jgi:hypothetical protein
MKRVMAAGLVCLLWTSSTVVARDAAPAALARGAQIGIVNLLDPEVMHYHSARDLKDTFLKFQAVKWGVDEMLKEALREPLEQIGVTAVPLAATDTLVRSREDCYVNASLLKGLPKGCSRPLVELAASAGVGALVLLAPGLNNSDHAGSSRDGMSERLRGWGFITSQHAGSKDKPALFNETELLLIGITAEGATVRARAWGGIYTMQWRTYTAPPDPKEIPAATLNELQPLFAAILSRQAQDLLGQVHVDR